MRFLDAWCSAQLSEEISPEAEPARLSRRRLCAGALLFGENHGAAAASGVLPRKPEENDTMPAKNRFSS